MFHFDNAGVKALATGVTIPLVIDSSPAEVPTQLYYTTFNADSNTHKLNMF